MWECFSSHLLQRHGRVRGLRALQFGVYKIFVNVEAVVHETNTRRPYPPICIGHTVTILLHGHWAV